MLCTFWQCDDEGVSVICLLSLLLQKRSLGNAYLLALAKVDLQAVERERAAGAVQADLE
jgi:hypothetical protein